MIHAISRSIGGRKKAGLRSCLQPVFAAFWLLLIAGAASPLLAQEEANPITGCFLGPATRAAESSSGKDDLARSLAETKAGKLCEPVAEKLIRECLSQNDQADDETKDHYACIGLAANPCIDSDWASSDFRAVVCIGTEERVWLDIIHSALNELKINAGDKLKTPIAAMEKTFFSYRKQQCRVVRALREGQEPDIAYAACTTESAARFAIDLRDMLAGTEPQSAEAPEGKTGRDGAKQGTSPGAAAETPVLGSKSAPVRAHKPEGQKAYLKRLRCPDGSAPSFSRTGSTRYGGYGNIVDIYRLRCPNTEESHTVYMDMYHPGHIETQPVPGFTLAGE